jgi:phytoene/squalene synthetase
VSYGPDRDWLIRFCPPEQAAALTALFTVEREVSASLRGELEHQVAHARLEWWLEELTRLVEGAARHPATRALAAAASTQRRSPPDLRSLVEHVRVDLAGVAFLSREELDQHLHAWGNSVFREVALGAGAPPAMAEQLSSRAGAPVRELELLAEFSRHARAGRIYRPLGEPAEPHARWQADPLGVAEIADLEARRRSLAQQICDAASATTSASRPSLRVPLLWMGYAIERIGRAHPSALRRTLDSWRSAVTLSRGNLPRTLSR